jgi:hypothetical protein
MRYVYLLAVSGVPVWSPLALTILGAQLALFALVLGVTFYLQSRNQDSN